MGENGLQLGLLALGAGVLVAVWGYTQWQIQRLKPKQAKPPKTSSNANNAADQPTDPVFDSAQVIEPFLAPPQPKAEATHTLDVLLDSIATMPFDQPVSGDAIALAVPRTKRVGAKALIIEASADGMTWQTPQPGQRYRSLRLGLQLANRGGALNEIEYSEFMQLVGHLGESLNGAPEWPDMMHEVARARELDRFAGDHDAQLRFSVRATRALWSAGYVTQQAASLGWVPGAIPGRMVLLDPQTHQPVLALTYETQAALADDPSAAAIGVVSLSLDVPHVPQAAHGYEQLCRVSAALALRIEGVVTDDNGNLLTQAAMESIGKDLEVLYDALASHDFAAGSPLAKRLFS